MAHTTSDTMIPGFGTTGTGTTVTEREDAGIRISHFDSWAVTGGDVDTGFTWICLIEIPGHSAA